MVVYVKEEHVEVKIVLPKSLLNVLEDWMKREGYTSRTEAIRALIRSLRQAS